MNINDMRAALKDISEDANLLKRTVLKEVNDGVIIDEDTKHEFDALLLQLECDINTASVFWAKLQRLTPTSKKFVAVR